MRWEEELARLIDRGVKAIFGDPIGTAKPRARPRGRRSDADDVLRFDRTRPKGVTRSLAEYVSVGGVTKGQQTVSVEEFIAGSDRSLELVRDPQNPYDPNAIKVLGRWKTQGGVTVSRQLGWVPTDVAQGIAEDAAKGKLTATLASIYLPTESKSPGIRMDIWARAKPKPTKPAGDDEPNVHVID